MKKRYIKILIFLSFIVLFSSTRVAAQRGEKENKITIESVVKDVNGNPIKGAIVYGNEGATFAKTDASGRFTILVSSRTNLLIESDGYEPTIFTADEIPLLKEFSLKSSVLMYGNKDVVNVAFGKVKKGDIVNSVSIVNPEELLKYNNIQDVVEALSGRVPGLLGSSNIRGRGTALFIVDGLPRDVNTINLDEVAQITVMKDVNSSILYGNDAGNGIILVTTKRGQAYKKVINVTGYYGVSIPTALPKYLSSSDFMKLNNEARLNDGLLPQYDSASISNYSIGSPYRYPSIDYYSNEYLKSVKPFSKIMTEISGGNSAINYYSNISWDKTGNLLNFGAGKSGTENQFKIRGNVDMRINSWIKSSLDAVVVLDNTEKPVSNYWSAASGLKPNLFAPLLPINLIRPTNTLLLSRKNDVNGMYMLGGTSSYLTNPIADGYSGGVTDSIRRNFSFNNRIDVDLGKVVKGLAFHTNVSFDLFMRYNQAINNTYSVYTPTWNASDSIVSMVQYGADSRPGTQNIASTYYERRFGFYAMLDYDRTFDDVHHVSGSLLGYGNRYKIQGDFQGNKNMNLGLRLNYSYKNKYLVDFSSAFVNSVKLPEGHRTALSPSLGLAWVLSSEDFMSAVKFVDYLKLRATGGILNTDVGIGGFYYYDDGYTTSNSYSWYEATYSNSGVIPNHGVNLQLGYQTRKELNFGFEGLLFDRLIGVDANIFTSTYSNIITKSQTLYPSFYYNFYPYQNSDKNAYNGAELGLSINKSFGDFSLVVGANVLYANSKVLKRDEIWGYDYLYRKGRSTDAMFGLVSEGLFVDQADINNHALQSYGIVKPGDIKYVDQNKDGVIDANDQIQIGRSIAPYSYGLNVKLSYKSLTLFAEGVGRIGADSYISGNYYWVDGNKKYSDYILDRWTPATASTATYPRLTSIANNNDFQNSTFWLYRDNYFSISRIQLTYNLPETVAKVLLMKNLSLFISASNLPVFSKHRAIRELSIGNEPYYRSYSVGLKMMF
jgi:TonB-linked SusC/RagA family outer membrane protein